MKKPIVLPLIIALCTLLSDALLTMDITPIATTTIITIMTTTNASRC